VDVDTCRSLREEEEEEEKKKTRTDIDHDRGNNQQRGRFYEENEAGLE
jgi:hypothetical protein